MTFNQPGPHPRVGPEQPQPRPGLGTPEPQRSMVPPGIGQPIMPMDFFRRMPGGGTVFVKPSQPEFDTVELPDR